MDVHSSDDRDAPRRPPNAWQKLRAVAELSVVVAESLSLHDQIRTVLQEGGFTAKRQPASQIPRKYAESDLLDDSDGESEVDERDDDEDYQPPSRVDRIALGRLATIVGLRPASGRRTPLTGGRFESRLGDDAADASPGKQSQRAPRVEEAQQASAATHGAPAKLSTGPPLSPAAPQSLTAVSIEGRAAAKARRGSKAAKGSHTACAEPSHALADTVAPSGANGRRLPSSTLPLVDEAPIHKSRPRRGKGQRSRSRSLLTAEEKGVAKEKDKARRQRSKAKARQFHAILASAAVLQRRMRSQTAQAAKDRRLAAPRMLQLLRSSTVVRADIAIERMFHGASFFTNTYHVREEEKGHSTASADGTPLPFHRDSPLHCDCNALVLDLVENEGYTYVKNDLSRPQICLDANGRPFATKVQQPTGEWYARAVAQVTALLEDLRTKLKLRPDSPNIRHTRGRFDRFTFGASHGGGQKRPTRIAPDWTKHNENLIIKFLQEPDVVDIIKHIESCVFTWLPDVAALYKDLEAKIEVPAALRTSRLFNLPFAAHTFNLGPFVQCWFHHDARNFVLGWCPVFVMGRFNHRTSGQFIMVEPRLIVELRPGDLMLMMSSVITHGTAPLRAGETRLSWTCFTAGAFFRWDAAGQKLVGDLTEDEHATYEEQSRRIFAQAWRANLTLEELQERYQAEAGLLHL